MPVRAHSVVGQRLQRVLRAPGLPFRAYERLNRLRSELDSWAAHEHRDLPNERFLGLYYGEAPLPGPPLSRAIGRYVADLEAAKVTLRSHYPPCIPLRAWEREADQALRDMRQA